MLPNSNQNSTLGSPSSWQTTAIRSRLSRAVAEQSAVRLALESAQRTLASHRAEYEALLAAKEIVQTISLDCQQQCQQRIAFVVTRCLEAVFGDKTMRFSLVFEQKRGQTEVRGVLLDAEGHELDPINSCGGGVLDVAAFGLRLACMMLMRPRPAKVLVLDEPFKFVSSGYRPAITQLLQELSQEMGVQIIMVTHLPELMAIGHQVEINGQ
jgi:DNA repair exonuclease SbcCD ATPase subunit